MIKRILLFIVLSVVFFTMVFSIAAILRSPSFRVKEVIVEGNLQPENQIQLTTLISPFAQKNLFRVQLNSLQSAIQQLPWVSEAEVKRIWPDKIVINLVDQMPIVAWNTDQVLNVYGEILPKEAFSQAQVTVLPQFFGDDDSSIKMLDYYQQMNRILQSLNVKVKTLRLTEDQTWQVELDNGIILYLGDEQILTRLQRFVRVYPNVVSTHKKQPYSIDLRYAHGMAVRW